MVRTGENWSKSTFATDRLKIWNFNMICSFALLKFIFGSRPNLVRKWTCEVGARQARVKFKISQSDMNFFSSVILIVNLEKGSQLPKIFWFNPWAYNLWNSAFWFIFRNHSRFHRVKFSWTKNGITIMRIYSTKFYQYHSNLKRYLSICSPESQKNLNCHTRKIAQEGVETLLKIYQTFNREKFIRF